MRKRHALPVLAAALLAAWLLLPQHQNGPPPHEVSVVAPAPEPTTTGQEIIGEGVVVRLLPDDTHGGRHQRFVLRLPSGRTLLVAHNIDVAPRVAPLAVGDVVAFHGEYASNPQGGVVHWTHRDPAGRHEAGWLRKDGRTFQ